MSLYITSYKIKTCGSSFLLMYIFEIPSTWWLIALKYICKLEISTANIADAYIKFINTKCLVIGFFLKNTDNAISYPGVPAPKLNGNPFHSSFLQQTDWNLDSSTASIIIAIINCGTGRDRALIKIYDPNRIWSPVIPGTCPRLSPLPFLILGGWLMAGATSDSAESPPAEL